MCQNEIKWFQDNGLGPFLTTVVRNPFVELSIKCLIVKLLALYITELFRSLRAVLKGETRNNLTHASTVYQSTRWRFIAEREITPLLVQTIPHWSYISPYSSLIAYNAAPFPMPPIRNYTLTHWGKLCTPSLCKCSRHDKLATDYEKDMKEQTFMTGQVIIIFLNSSEDKTRKDRMQSTGGCLHFQCPWHFRWATETLWELSYIYRWAEPLIESACTRLVSKDNLVQLHVRWEPRMLETALCYFIWLAFRAWAHTVPSSGLTMPAA